jgi:carboxyl-terminal processing protease
LPGDLYIMVGVRKLLLALVLVLVACGDATHSTTTSAGVAETLASIPTTTTLSAQPMEIQDCTTPPLAFSALCEVYELVQDWHVDRPLPPLQLAEVALNSLANHISTQTEERPRTLFCAVPDEAFEEFCDELAAMVWESGIAIGPAIEEAVVAMTDLGLDPFTYYVPPEQVGSFRQNGVVGGVGVLLDATNPVGSKCARIDTTCPLEIVVVLENNPGAEAGLMAGDRIISVNGEPVDGQGFAATATEIAGDETGTVTITVDREGETVEFEIERQAISVPTVDVSLPLSNVGYLRIPDFEADITDLVEQALTSLVEASPDTIVIDLRDNPGGFVETVIEVASQFMNGGTVLETSGPNENFRYPAEGSGLATSQRLIILVNRGTASAAEILAGALRDERSAVIVGSNTFGKDAVQIPFQLRNGGELYVAVARWSTPSGSTAANGGLTPDRELQFPTDSSVDELVRAALDAAS